MSVSPITISGLPTLTINGLNVANSISATADYLPIYTASATATQAITRNVYLGISSQPLGLTDTQSPTNKTFNNTNSLTIKDGSLTLQNTTDTTKQLNLGLSALTTGTTSTLNVPVISTSDTIATLGATQTLVAKTLTSPTINGPTITNATISADLITGFTVSGNGTIYGIAVTGSTIGPTALSTGAITLGYAQITTSTSTQNNNTAVSGLTLTVTIPAGGRKIRISAVASGVTGSAANASYGLAIWDGTVGSGTQLASTEPTAHANNAVVNGDAYAVITPAAGSKTYNVGVKAGSGTATVNAATTSPAYIFVEVL